MRTKFRRSKQHKKNLNIKRDLERIASKYNIPFGYMLKSDSVTYLQPDDGKIQSIIDAFFKQLDGATEKAPR